jgi:hypothetical protein
MAIGLVQTGSGFTWNGAGVLAYVDRKIIENLHRGGQAVVARAQQLAPVKTGALRAGIDYQVIGKTLTIISRVPYGLFQEQGTRTVPAHPHIRPALLELGRLWGGSLAMQFNTPNYLGPVLAHQAGFTHPSTLTSKQREHIHRNLMPVSKRLYKGNVRRAKFRAR